jgi:hypothetical protein
LNCPETPDRRYFVAKDRLWRKSNPALSEDERRRLVAELMAARRAVRDAADEEETRAARARVHAAKVALGERGPVWWNDGAPDENRKHPKNSTYAEWWAARSQS